MDPIRNPDQNRIRKLMQGTGIGNPLAIPGAEKALQIPGAKTQVMGMVPAKIDVGVCEIPNKGGALFIQIPGMPRLILPLELATKVIDLLEKHHRALLKRTGQAPQVTLEALGKAGYGTIKGPIPWEEIASEAQESWNRIAAAIVRKLGIPAEMIEGMAPDEEPEKPAEGGA